jgi:hypothetical protein
MLKVKSRCQTCGCTEESIEESNAFDLHVEQDYPTLNELVTA